METKRKKSRLFCFNYSTDIEKVIFVLCLIAEKRNVLVKTNQEIEDATKELKTAKEVTRIAQSVPVR